MNSATRQVRLQVIDKSTQQVVRDIDATGHDTDVLAAEIMRNMDVFRYESRVVVALPGGAA